MTYQDDPNRDYSQPPEDIELLEKEINEFSHSVEEISNSIRRMGVNFNVEYQSTMVIIETLLEMLFKPDGLLDGRQFEFFWKSNRKTLQLMREVYAKAMEAKLSVPPGIHRP